MLNLNAAVQRYSANDDHAVPCCVVLQALQEHAPEEWDSLPDLQQKRQAYYAALEAPNRTLIGTQQVRLTWTLCTAPSSASEQP